MHLREMSEHRQKLCKNREQNFKMFKSFSRDESICLGGTPTNNYYLQFILTLDKKLDLETVVSVSKVNCFMLKVHTATIIGDVYDTNVKRISEQTRRKFLKLDLMSMRNKNITACSVTPLSLEFTFFFQ